MSANNAQTDCTILQIAKAQKHSALYFIQPVRVVAASDSLPGVVDDNMGPQPGGIVFNSQFHDKPHLIGYEGECVHLYYRATLSWADIISALLELYPTEVEFGKDLTSLKRGKAFSRVYTGAWQSLPNYYNIGTFPFYTAKSFSGDGQTYTYSVHSTGSAYSMLSNISDTKYLSAASNTQLTDVKDRSYTFSWQHERYCSEAYYKATTWPKNYWTKCGEQYYHHEQGENTGTWANALFLKVPTSLIWRVFNTLRSRIAAKLSVCKTPRIPLMPVEESFLDDLYECLDRPSYNAVASIIEVCGSVRNAKSLSKLFKSIRQSGGIRKHLAKEASHLLKDESTLKTASDLYLTKKYVYETCRMDIDDFFQKLSSRLSRLANPVQHFLYQQFDAKSNSYAKHCIRIAYHNPQQSWAALNGFDLPLEATWDIIPYSFVVDWFCSFGDSFESIEKAEAVIQEIDVVCCTESTKVTSQQSIDVSILGVDFPITAVSVAYNRQVSDMLPPVYPQSPQLSNPFNHIIDGAALLFSKKA